MDNLNAWRSIKGCGGNSLEANQMTYLENMETALKPQGCKWEDLKAVKERVTVDTDQKKEKGRQSAGMKNGEQFSGKLLTLLCP